MGQKVLFFSTSELNFIQEIMDKYSKNKPDYHGSCWRIIKIIKCERENPRPLGVG